MDLNGKIDEEIKTSFSGHADLNYEMPLTDSHLTNTSDGDHKTLTERVEEACRKHLDELKAFHNEVSIDRFAEVYSFDPFAKIIQHLNSIHDLATEQDALGKEGIKNYYPGKEVIMHSMVESIIFSVGEIRSRISLWNQIKDLDEEAYTAKIREYLRELLDPKRVSS